MFDYDRLALDVSLLSVKANFGAESPSPRKESPPRRTSSSTAQSIPNDIFDCGSSSGYGSPGGTPLASPQTAAMSVLPAHIQRAFYDQGFVDDFSNTHLSCSLAFDQPQKKSEVPVSPPAALEDGFSRDEIADFEQLLCSPKKQPPTKYQCHICYQSGHYISDCPMRFNSPYDELTPYQGRKKCYGEFQCSSCKRKWTSQNSVANEAQSCIKCHIPVFPHKQLPVEKALAMGYIKQARIAPTKLAPIGHGRPPTSNRQ